MDQAIFADPDDGIAHTFGFTVSKGLSDRQALQTRLRPFLMARRRPVSGFAEYANARSAKWLGSAAEAFEFAHETFMLDLPASTGLIPDTHYVEWGARVMASVGQGEQPRSFAEHLALGPVRDDILRANDAFNQVGPDVDPYANLYANCNFFYAFLSMNEPDLTRPHLVGQGNYVGGPWADLPDPAEALQTTRRRLSLETL